MVVAEGIGGGHVVSVKVHEDWPRTKYDVAVTFPVHARLVTEAKHAVLAVAERVGILGVLGARYPSEALGRLTPEC